MMVSTRCFRGDRPALTGLRLRRIVSFLRRHRLYDTAHALEKQTGAFFDAAHFRRLLRHLRWADASSYVLSFIAVGDCSREADMLVVRILILRVMDDLAAGGRTHDIDALFQRLYASLQSHPDGHHLRRILLSMRSDPDRACRLYNRFRPMAVEVILNMAAKCPELKAKAQLPRCTSDPAYILSLGPRLRGCNGSRINKAGRLPADVLARSFMQKRPLVSHEINHSGMKPQSFPVVRLHLRRLDRFLKRQGLNSIAHTLERESMVYFDAGHLQKLVKGGRWEAAGTYLSGFSRLWEGEGTTQKYTSFLHNMQHHAMLAYLACRGEEGGRAASSLFCCNDDDAFRKRFPEIAERNDLYRSMASAQTRASVDWEGIKLKTLEELQELLHLPDIKCSLRTQELQCTPTTSEITPLGCFSQSPFNFFSPCPVQQEASSLAPSSRALTRMSSTLPVCGGLGGIKGREWSTNQHVNSDISFYRRRRGFPPVSRQFSPVTQVRSIQELKMIVFPKILGKLLFHKRVQRC